MFSATMTMGAGQNSTEFGEVGWYKEQFEVCDHDKNGLLNFTKFNKYGH